LEQPVPFSAKGFFKDNKVMVIIVNEDTSASIYWCNLPDSYIFHIKKKAYFLVPKAVITGKYPIIIYFYNNPFPLFLEFKKSEFGLRKMLTEEEFGKLLPAEKVIVVNTVLDADSIHLAFNARIFNNLFERPGWNMKVVLIFVVIGIVVLLLILQFTGVVDIFGMLGMGGKK
jgi:hypothetical protein